MSNFECPVVRVSIEAHPNADAIEIAIVGGYRSIVKKGQFQTGDLAVYLPEQSILPDWLLMNLGFWDKLNSKGTLNGSAGNRIKAIKLRGVLSQGVLVRGPQRRMADSEFSYSMHPPQPSPNSETGVTFDPGLKCLEAECAAEHLGVVKYEPHVPAQMAGRVAGGDLDASIGYDFENIKKFPTLFDNGDIVVMTEKIHGTLLQVGLIPESIYGGKKWADKLETMMVRKCNVDVPYKMMVTSKGMGANGLLLDTSDVANLYVKIATELKLWDALAKMMSVYGCPPDKPMFLFGEIFGKSVQDLGYGTAAPTFQAFDMYVGTRSDGYYISHWPYVKLCEDAGVPMVPELYNGPYSQEKVDLHTTGTTLTGQDLKQIREGLVIKAVSGARHEKYGRKIAKSISSEYLLRKGNATEFQ